MRTSSSHVAVQCTPSRGETVILLHLPLPVVGVSIVTERDRQQIDSLADSCARRRGIPRSICPRRPAAGMRTCCSSCEDKGARSEVIRAIGQYSEVIRSILCGPVCEWHMGGGNSRLLCTASNVVLDARPYFILYAFFYQLKTPPTAHKYPPACMRKKKVHDRKCGRAGECPGQQVAGG